MPFLLKAQELEHENKAVDCNAYVAKFFKAQQHLRDPADIDQQIDSAYFVLYDAVYLMSDVHHFEHYIRPRDAKDYMYGFSYLDEAKTKGKSKFLGDFLSTKKMIY